MPQMCTVSDCNTHIHARGLCAKHLKRLRKYGTTEPSRSYIKGTALERFLHYANKKEGDDHWIWSGTTKLNNRGVPYGTLYTGSKMVFAHRFSYEHFNGPIPDELVIDHKCRVTLCVNPGHLEVVTHAENRRRGKLGILK